MKKLIYTLLLALVTPAAWTIDAVVYTDSNQLPEAFTIIANRYDYRGTDDNGDPILVNIQSNIIIDWNPTYVNDQGHYGKLSISNFYKNDALKNYASVDFINRDNLNFRWDEGENKIYFSFTGKYFADAKTVAPYSSAYGKLSACALFAAAKHGDNRISRYWQSGEYVSYAYNGGVACNCVLDLETKSISIEQPWGVFMLKDRYGATPSYVLEYFEKSEFKESPLSEIVTDNKVGDDVIVADDLLAVKTLTRYLANGNTNTVVLAKDMNRYAQKNVCPEGAFDYMKKTGVFNKDYDQSNWVLLNYNFTSNNDDLQGKVLKGGTIKGTFTDKLNPTIYLSQLPETGEMQTYEPNTFIVPSFCDAYQGSSEFFFVQPKPQEFCTVQWANYDEDSNAFFVPASEGNSNIHDLSGGFTWNNSYTQDSPEDTYVYTFPAVVNLLSNEEPTYNVWVRIIDSNHNDALMEDNGTFIYTWKGDEKPMGAWPGTRLNVMNNGWYFISLGSNKPDGIIFNRNGVNNAGQTANITDLVLGDNFFKYYPFGSFDRYMNLSGLGHVPASSVISSNGPRRETSTPKTTELSNRYMVMPLELDKNSVVTAVSDVRTDAAIAEVRYCDIMGRVSNYPQRGVNIVITRHTDGTITTTKAIF